MASIHLAIGVLCAALVLCASVTSGASAEPNLPSAAVVQAVTAMFDLQPSNTSSPFACPPGYGAATNISVVLSLLEPGATGANVQWNAGCSGSNAGLSGAYLTAYQPPLWRGIGDYSYAAVFHGTSSAPFNGNILGQATVILCPPGGEAMNQLFEFKQRPAGYQVFTFYYWDEAFC